MTTMVEKLADEIEGTEGGEEITGTPDVRDMK